MLAILVKRAWALEDLLVLLIIVVLGARFINYGDDVVLSAVAILTRFGPFWLITATVLMVTAIVVAAVAVASIVAAVSSAMNAHILVEAYFSLFGVGILIGGCNHLANPLRRLAIKLGEEVMVMESSDEGNDDLCFRDVGDIEFLISEKRLM